MTTDEIGRALGKATKGNIASMTRQLNEQNNEITRLKMKLEKFNKKIIAPVINTTSFDNFIGYV